MLAASALPSAAQAPAAAQADEIVVTAQRSGIPVWRVTGPKTTLVLVGSIEGVARETRWSPDSLTQTLRKADRIMFPSQVGVSAGAFSIIGMVFKLRKQATLPGGQTLANLLPAADYQRLVALSRRGVLKPGFERRHPLHLAIALRSRAEKQAQLAAGADHYVRRAAKKYKLTTVPIRNVRAKAIAGDFFAIPPRAYLTCLMDTVRMTEAGPAAIRARSAAWAQRRVPDVMASPVEPAYESCSAAVSAALPRADLRGQMRELMGQPKVTVAVVDLHSLATRGGVLDDLSAAGFDIRGPRWTR
ncbi:MAG TPA: TraB/GumN family protein [Allosphingosinicella sp.]|jgi:uncharacterized protein YbaP (TraB family)